MEHSLHHRRHLKAPDEEGEGLGLLCSHNLASWSVNINDLRSRLSLSVTFHCEIVERIIEVLGLRFRLEAYKLSVLLQNEISLSPVLYMFS